MKSVLTMDSGCSPGAFPHIEDVAVQGINSGALNWVNAMVSDPEQSPDNR